MKLSVKITGIFAVVAFALTAVGSVDAAFTRNLTKGSTGADVIELQTWLESKGLLTIPAGTSKGYFGELTRLALAKYQMSAGISPAVGYFGPITMAKIAAEGSMGTGTGTGTGTGSNSGSGLSGGDGDFKSFKLLGSPSSEDVHEGESVQVVGYEFEAKDSDLSLDRIELLASSTSGTVTKPWKVLDTVAIFNGSKQIGDIDASDKDNWDEVNSSGTYTIKLSGLKSVVKEGDKAKIYVEVTAANSLDSTDLGSWDLGLTNDGIRAFNAEGIDVVEGSTSDKKNFSIKDVKAGDVSITVDDADNKDATISVDDSNDTTDQFAYLAKVKSKTGDNNVEKVSITLNSPSSQSLSSMIDTVYLLIDGDEVGSESAPAGTSGTVTFDDLNNDINEGDKVDFEVRYDINDTNDGVRYQNADTAQVTGMTVNYVDSNDDDQSVVSTTDGGVLTFSTSSVMVELANTDPTAKQIGADETKGAFAVSFTVTAPSDEDVYISKAGSSAYTYNVINSSTGATTTATTSSVTFSKVSGGSTSGAYYLISSGSTATFTSTVNVDNTGAGNRALRVGLTGVKYQVGSTAAPVVTYTSGLDENFETPDLQLFTVDAQ